MFVAKREVTARKVGKMGAKGLFATKALLRLLIDPRKEVRKASAWALGELGGGIGEAGARELCEALSDRDEEIRSTVSRSLGKIGEAALPCLRRLLKEGHPEARYYAARALGLLKEKGLVGLEEAMKDRDGRIRQAVVEAARDLPMGLGIGLLLTGLQDKREATRVFASWALIRVAPLAIENKRLALDELLPKLLHGLKDEAPQVRMYLARTLVEFGAKAEAAVEGLRLALEDKEWYIRKAAASALGAIGSGAYKAIPALSKGLQDETWDVREAAGSALIRMTKVKEDVQKALVTVLQDKRNDVKERIVTVIGAVGGASSAAINALTPYLRSPSSSLREQAALALARLGEAGSEALQKALEDKKPSVRKAAVLGLVAITPRAMPIQRALEKATTDPALAVQKAAAKALGKTLTVMSADSAAAALAREDKASWLLGIEALEESEASKEGIIAFLRASKHKDTEIRRRAFRGLGEKTSEALGRWGDEALRTQVIHAFARGLDDREALIRKTAAQGLGEYGKHALPVIKALEKALGDKESLVRGEAAVSLGWMGHKAEGAVPALQKALADRDPQVRKRAIFALAQSGEKGAEVLIASLAKAKASDVILQTNLVIALGRCLLERPVARKAAETIKTALASGGSKAVIWKADAEKAMDRLLSKDRPDVLWVEHPRAPTLEIFSPDLLLPPNERQKQGDE